MNQEVLTFLSQNRICTLAIALPDGTPHAAVLHYSHQDSPLEIYFSTDRTSRKYQALITNKLAKASVVIGHSEQEWITLQLDGTLISITDPLILQTIQGIHYQKLPDAEKYKEDPSTVFLAFKPTWWRYTDYNQNPPHILASDR